MGITGDLRCLFSLTERECGRSPMTDCQRSQAEASEWRLCWLKDLEQELRDEGEHRLSLYWITRL